MLQPTNFTGKDVEHLKAWERIREDLTWAEPKNRGEGKIDATIEGMIDQDAERCAQDILGLFLKLSGGLRS
jgi:hypothetical protein